MNVLTPRQPPPPPPPAGELLAGAGGRGGGGGGACAYCWLVCFKIFDVAGRSGQNGQTSWTELPERHRWKVLRTAFFPEEFNSWWN